MSDEFDAILNAYFVSPGDHFHLSVAADWLDDRGSNPLLAVALRRHALNGYAPHLLETWQLGPILDREGCLWAWHNDPESDNPEYTSEPPSVLTIPLWECVADHEEKWRLRYATCRAACEALWEAIKKEEAECVTSST
jgi:hypothetical protein